MEKEVLIEVNGLSKKFSRSLKKGMWYGLREIANTMFGLKGKKSTLRKDEFWSVKDINFELRRGECLALIGHNGAGKSTLLKMLNGLISPDEGSITMRGKVGALIELGAGFNPILTGRENIYVNGQLLGFTKKEIDSRLNSILEFAEIGEFIDSPIQNYSSGMKVRLGFAIAAQMEPDVLIIDEVLAVGDLGFVLKCFNTIDKLLENSAVIFVSHSMPQVSRICSSIIYMEKGRAVFQGNETSKGIDHYYSSFGNRVDKSIVFDRDQDAIFNGIMLGAETDYVKDLFQVNRLDNLDVRIRLQVRQSIRQFYVSLAIFDKEQRSIGVCQMDKPVADDKIIKTENGYNIYELKLSLPRINLSKGLYSISFSVSEEYATKPLLRVQSVKNFQVFSKNDIWPPIEFEGIWS